MEGFFLSTVVLQYNGVTLGKVTKVPGFPRNVTNVMDYIFSTLERISDKQISSNNDLSNALVSALYSHDVCHDGTISDYRLILKSETPTEADLAFAAGLLGGRFLFVDSSLRGVTKIVIQEESFNNTDIQ
jgi:hypothetical protein